MRSKRADGSPPAAAGTRTSLAFRVVLLVVGVALTVAAIAWLVGAAMIRATAVDVTRNYLADQADVIAGQLSGEEPGYRIGLARLGPILAKQDISVVTVGRNGGVAGADKTAVKAAGQAGLADLADGGSISRTVTVGGVPYLVEARATASRTFALVTTAANGVGSQRILERRVLLALGIGLAVAVIAGLLVATLMARPLRRTAALARAMGDGARDVRAPVAGPQEVADVAVAVNELADALQQSETRQRSFLASVSHELRTPLAAIDGQSQALADGLVPAAEVPAVAATITAESARLGRLVSDLLDLARLGADSFHVELAPCDLVTFVADAARVWTVRCSQRGVPLTVELPDGSLLVSTDVRRLRQVLDGLAENALRLLTPGRPLVFAVAAVPNGAMVPNGASVPNGAMVRNGGAAPNRGTVPTGAVVQVRDGGPGLAPEDYPVAFVPGVLHERYRGRRPGGAGLGLALAGSLVTRLGGRISAGPAPEGGVAMTIELPGLPG